MAEMYASMLTLNKKQNKYKTNYEYNFTSVQTLIHYIHYHKLINLKCVLLQNVSNFKWVKSMSMQFSDIQYLPVFFFSFEISAITES